MWVEREKLADFVDASLLVLQPDRMAQIYIN